MFGNTPTPRRLRASFTLRVVRSMRPTILQVHGSWEYHAKQHEELVFKAITIV